MPCRVDVKNVSRAQGILSHWVALNSTVIVKLYSLIRIDKALALLYVLRRWCAILNQTKEKKKK
jgi:hypothetical protein